ncbi:uncharacterized protein LOC135197167 isoform X2 [Macrobrachium nipponense]|uniref:uncharacterized protein LOC135197167 isoform X2 n=1 Tax=Macrobrachium nipponense TaxID=159736 RepID=UPI0030C8100B
MSSAVMLIWITTSLLLFARDGYDFVSCQSIDTSVDIQSFLNQFCSPGSTNPGCGGTAIIPPNSAPPSPPVTTPSSPPVTAPPTVSTDCSANERQCPQLGAYCFPSSVDCDAIGTVTCPLPQDYGVETQVLICGSGSSSGARCGDDRNVPVLTLLMVQCQGSNSIRESHVERFSALNGTGDDGGAGVYLCSATGQWDRKHGSTIENLIVSCRDAGCGRIPHPTNNMPVYRRWPWVRGIYKDDQFICTGTLVSQNALVTAAHCVTESNSAVADAFLDAYRVELPGLVQNHPMVRVQPTDIFIHPKYSRNDNEYRHDMAVIFFKLRHQQRLPTVCITNHQYSQELGRAQVAYPCRKGLPEALTWLRSARTWRRFGS